MITSKPIVVIFTLSSPTAAWRTYSEIPIRLAAKAPRECESAVRCGTAVIGIRSPMLPPNDRANGEPDSDPSVVDDLGVEERARNGHQHAECGKEHSPSGVLGRTQTLQPQDEQNRRQDVEVAQSRNGQTGTRQLCVSSGPPEPMHEH